ncbi:MAG: hypothetical protein EPO21_18010 [Chloroflexota bacterium]|nr:MAG: hypothetical protein EPO21_18010 [Chloroflexota bacterium]
MTTDPAVIERAKAGDMDAAVQWGMQLWYLIAPSGKVSQPPEHPTWADVCRFHDEVMSNLARDLLRDHPEYLSRHNDADLAAIGKAYLQAAQP